MHTERKLTNAIIYIYKKKNKEHVRNGSDYSKIYPFDNYKVRKHCKKKRIRDIKQISVANLAEL